MPMTSVRSSSTTLDGHATVPFLQNDIHPIFVHDHGADALSFYIDVTEDRDEAGFVVRANQNRCTRTASGREDRLFE